jgi:hypothetical protein
MISRIKEIRERWRCHIERRTYEKGCSHEQFSYYIRMKSFELFCQKLHAAFSFPFVS